MSFQQGKMGVIFWKPFSREQRPVRRRLRCPIAAVLAVFDLANRSALSIFLYEKGNVAAASQKALLLPGQSSLFPLDVIYHFLQLIFK